jgi:spore coat polysaccharide biosynthesis protein SpsF (cytidylyltransferase family)
VSGTLVVVQARMGSTRLPGKVLMEVGGRPMLGLMLSRLQLLADRGIDVVVATSDLDRDDPVVDLAGRYRTPVVRGSEADVLERFVTALEHHPADDVVRLTADCPLIDPDVVWAVLEAHRASGRDYTSNTLVRTFPDGLDVEVIRASALEDANAEATDPAEREHVTPFVYRRTRRYLLGQVVCPQPLGRERWTVDRPEDLAVIRRAVEAVGDPIHAGWADLLAALGARVVPEAGPVLADPGPAVAHEPGRPYERVWRLTDPGGGPVGWATVSVDDGLGRMQLDLAPGADTRTTDAAVDAVRAWLAQDLQVTHLDVVPA